MRLTATVTQFDICSLLSKTWAVKMKEYPGVVIVFFLGRDQDQDTHVSLVRNEENIIKYIYIFDRIT